jgi:hypothetical protein
MRYRPPVYALAATSLLVAAFLAPALAHAAQDAVVTTEQAAIRERPTLDAKIIESRAAGTKLRVSDYNKDGWYKTKATTGQFGWVWQADISVLAFHDDVRAADLEMPERLHERRMGRSEPWLFFRGGGSMLGVISADVSNRLGQGLGHLYLAPGGFGEIAVRVEDRLRIAVRMFEYSSNGTVTLGNSSGIPARNYSVAMSSTPFLLGLDADVSRSEVFDVSAGFYAGLGLSNKITVTETDFDAPNSFTITQTHWAILVNFTAKYWFNRWFCAVGEVGGYYSALSHVQVPNAFNGDGPFRDDAGNLSILNVNHLGPLLGLGLQIAL